MLIVYTFYSDSQLMKSVTSSNATFLPIWILPTTLSAASGTLNEVFQDLLQQLNGRIHSSASTLKTILSSCSRCASILTSSYSILQVQISFITSSIILYQFITFIHLLYASVLCSYWNSTETYKNWKCITKGAQRSSLLVQVRKCLGSHRKLRPAGAEYELNDGWLGNMAAHSGFPYVWDKMLTN